MRPDYLDDLIAKLEATNDAGLADRIADLKALKNTAEYDLKDWNTFRTAIQGKGYSQAEMGQLWEKYKNANGIVYDAATGSSSKKLRDALIAAGKDVPTYDNAAHHIVAGTSQKATEAREILESFDIGINEAANGVFLPTVEDVSDAAYHPSLHTDEYYNKVTELLFDADNKEQALNILKKIADELTAGTFMN